MTHTQCMHVCIYKGYWLRLWVQRSPVTNKAVLLRVLRRELGRIC